MDDAFWLSFLALWILVGTLILIQIDSWKKIVKLHRRSANLPLGPPSSVANETASNGAHLPWEGRLPDDTGLVIAFTTASASCSRLAREVADAMSSLPPTVILLASDGEEDGRFLEESGLTPDRVVLVVGFVLRRVGLDKTPAALWLQSGQRIRVARVEHIRDVETLVDVARRSIAGSATISGGHSS